MARESDTHLFDSASADAYRWLDEICNELGWIDRKDALHALRAALHVLRDRLGPEQNAHLSAQLPTLIRGIYFEGWQPGHAEHPERALERYLEEIRSQLGRSGEELDAFEVARTVYALLRRHVSEGEYRKVAATLPHQLRVLWDPV